MGMIHGGCRVPPPDMHHCQIKNVNAMNDLANARRDMMIEEAVTSFPTGMREGNNTPGV